jgi:hypothetical protein
MRRLLTTFVLLASSSTLGVACTGPHSTGALWAQQNLEHERTMFQLTDAQRTGAAQAFELGLADESLQTEHGRVTAELQNCPGPRQPLAVSPGDSVRDGIRVQSQGEPARLAAAARLSLADWYVRRASATGNAQLCDRARTSLAGTSPASESFANVLSSVPTATVVREQGDAAPAPTSDPPLVTLSGYALGAVDAVTAPAPLPQYLAAVYGGFVSSEPVLDEEAAAALVDRQAPAYAEWEPDALYAALRGSQS